VLLNFRLNFNLQEHLEVLEGLEEVEEVVEEEFIKIYFKE
jgi:hypothetical protein